MGFTDIVGKPIIVGQTILFPNGKLLKVGIVKKINPKTISIHSVDGEKVGLYYPFNVYVIDHPAITKYILQHS